MIRFDQHPAIPGALQACQVSNEAGYRLVCVSALNAKYGQARRKNLSDLGFPIDDVVITDGLDGKVSPKANAISANE